MRKKIGKRIGPVPIALVAVLALAAFISAGLLLTVNGNLAQAQGMPGGTATSDDEKCEVILHDETPDSTNVNDVVSGGGCFVADETVDVIFKNTNAAGTSDKSIAVYVTGGGDFPGLQATDEVDNELMSLGAEGIDEHLRTVKMQEEGFGGQDVPGTETITVSRDMAKDGEVYLFVYLAGQGDNGEEKTFPDGDDVGIPISVLIKEIKEDADPNDVQDAAIALAGTSLIDLMAAAVEAARFDPPLSGQIDLPPLFTADELADFTAPVANNELDTAAEARDNVEEAAAKIAEIKVENDYDNVGRSPLHAAVAAAEVAIMRALSAVDAIEGADPSYFLNDSADIVVRVNFREIAVEAKKEGGKYVPFDNKKTGSTIYVARETTSTVTKGEDIRPGAEEAKVAVVIKDRFGVALSGFVDFSVDTSAAGAAGAVFAESSRSSHYEELVNGTATVTIENLSKTDPLKIPVTANFNNGELELTSTIVRKGDATMVTATAYVCEPDVSEETKVDHDEDSTTDPIDDVLPENMCVAEVAALSTTKTSDDPDEVVALGPEDTFFVNAKATDAVGNKVGGGVGTKLTWKLTAGADNIDDAEKAIPAEDGDANEPIVVASGSDAVPGVYSITVTSHDGEASTMIMVTVSDEATTISVSCDPVMIPTDTGLTQCSIMVTDVNGNVPSNLHEGGKMDMARVAVRSSEVTLIGTNPTNDVELDEKGMAMFSILLREDAPEGSSITVNVSSTIGSMALQDSTTVMYGEAAPMPEPMPMPSELTAPSGVVVSSLANTQSVSVTWDTTSIENAQQVKVVLFNSGVTGLAQVDGALITINAANDMGSHTFSDVPAGMYNVVVASFRTGERHKLSPLQEVTVE